MICARHLLATKICACVLAELCAATAPPSSLAAAKAMRTRQRGRCRKKSKQIAQDK